MFRGLLAIGPLVCLMIEWAFIRLSGKPYDMGSSRPIVFYAYSRQKPVQPQELWLGLITCSC